MCVKKGSERENIMKIIQALQKISSLLPPPIPPPPPDFTHTARHRASDTVVFKLSGQPKEVENENRKKMADSVILELKTKLK